VDSFAVGAPGLGSAHVSPVGFGVASKQAFQSFGTWLSIVHIRKVRDGEDALANTLDACATRKLLREKFKILLCF
jgi:hypothetical protein